MVVFAGLAGGTCAHAVSARSSNIRLSSREDFERDSHLKYLITGGAGFIGSHLSDRLTADGHEVVVLDDLSTGRIDNIEHLIRSGRIEFVEGSVTDEDLVLGVLESVDACVHLASIVGVSLVVDNPVDTLLSNVRGSDVVLSAAAGLRKRVAVRLDLGGLREALERRARRGRRPHPRPDPEVPLELRDLEVVRRGARARLRAGARRARTPSCGCSTPSARARPACTAWCCRASCARRSPAQPLTVFGDGTQTRCFAHVYDTVDALVRLLDCDDAAGRVFNIGNDAEISIMGLARRVIARSRLGLRRPLRARTRRPTTRASRSSAAASRTRASLARAHRLGAGAQRRRRDRRRDPLRARRHERRVLEDAQVA